MATKKEEILGQVLAVIDQMQPDAEVFLYGSRARKEETSDSDWDLLILLNAAELPLDTEIKLINALYEIELKTGEVIAPMIYTKQDWEQNRSITPLYGNIEREGIKVK